MDWWIDRQIDKDYEGAREKEKDDTTFGASSMQIKCSPFSLNCLTII